MSARFEAVALKKLQELMNAKGISPEALFAKYDIDGNGALDLNEFKGAIASITGQNAPEPIIRAIFAALDTDGDSTLDIPEILALVEGGQSPTVSGDLSGVEISGHTNSNYNGVYQLQDGLINGLPWFSNAGGYTLYHYEGGAGGARSWSLHSTPTDGSKDLYDGGWTRPPSAGGVPFGSRRWVGVGMLLISAIGERSAPSAQEAERESTTEIRIGIDKERFDSTELIAVDFTCPPLAEDSWLGIVSADIDHGEEGANIEYRQDFVVIGGQTIGSRTLDNPGEGDWTIRMIDSSSPNKEIAYVEFSVDAAPEPTPPSVAAPAVSSTDRSSVSTSRGQDSYSVDKMLADLGPDFGSELEALVTAPDQTLETAKARADLLAAQRINELPFFFRAPAQRMWNSNSNSILARIAENLPPAEDLAQAAVVAGAVGAGAVAVAAHAGLEAQSPQEAVVEAVVDTVIEHAAGAVLESVAPAAETEASEAEPAAEEPATEAELEPEPEAVTEAAPEPAPEFDSSALNLVDVSRRLTESRFLNDQVAIIDSTEGQTTSATVHIDRLERTFSIGIDDAYRNGQTIIGSIEGVGEVEIHLRADVDTSSMHAHNSETFSVSVHKWNGIRKRLELNAL